MSRPVRVLMVGPDPDRSRGGMATVAMLLLRHGRGLARLRYLTTHRDGSIASRLAVWLTGSVPAMALLATGRVDVLHAHVAERGSVLRKGLLVAFARLFGVPVLLHCHGAEFAAFYRALPGFGRRVVSWVFRRADLVAVLGASWRDYYVDRVGVDPARVVVIGNPVRLPATLPDRTDRKVIEVLFLGRFGARKGSADVLAAAAALPPAARDLVRLRMAGDGELARTRDLAARLGVPARISGWLSPAERDAALAEADVFVLPSRDEGLPMALLEAMAAGLVPVVSPVGSIGEVVLDGENGILVAPGDVPGLAAALTALAEDVELRTRLAKSARAAAEPFATGSYVQRVAELWVRLSASRRRPG